MSVLKRYNGTTWETVGPEITSARFNLIDNMIAPEYSPTETYNIGDYVVQSDHLYKCISAIEEIEEWTPAHWSQISMGEEVSDLKSAFDNLEKETYDIIKSDGSLTNSIGLGYNASPTKSNQIMLGSSDITEVVFCGNKKIVFNNDGTVSWESLT